MTKDMLGEERSLWEPGPCFVHCYVPGAFRPGDILCSCLTSYCNYYSHANTFLIQPLTIFYFPVILTEGGTTPHPEYLSGGEGRYW